MSRFTNRIVSTAKLHAFTLRTFYASHLVHIEADFQVRS